MLDSHGRNIHKLRISVTESCQLKCSYCMPEHPNFPKNEEYLSIDEIIYLVAKLADLGGIDQVRLTGGEPLLRKGVGKLISILKKIGIPFVGLTTNALLLEQRVDQLHSYGVDAINVSLDTLNPERFSRMCKQTGLQRVLGGIKAARDLDIPVKTNTVLIRGENDDEIIPIIKYANEIGVMPRFLELMSIGSGNDQHHYRHVSYLEVLKKVERELGTVTIIPVPCDSTAMLYQVGELRFGIIASENKPFCQDCSRLRLSAKGLLFGCLMNSDGFDTREYIRSLEFDEENFVRFLAQVISTKPLERIIGSENRMNILGG